MHVLYIVYILARSASQHPVWLAGRSGGKVQGVQSTGHRGTLHTLCYLHREHVLTLATLKYYHILSLVDILLMLSLLNVVCAQCSLFSISYVLNFACTLTV